MDQVNTLILNMIVTNDISNKFLAYIYPWGENPAYIAYFIRDSYRCTIKTTSGKYIFGRDMIFNLVSAVDWGVITDGKQ